MCDGENPAKYSRRLASPVVLSAGASGLLIRRCHGLNVPEGRGPGNTVAIRLDDVGLTDLNSTVQVCAIKARTFRTKEVLNRIGLTASVDTVLMPVLSSLHGFLAANSNGLGVDIPLRHRRGAGVKPENCDEDDNEEEHKALPFRRLLVAVSHFTTLSSPRRSARALLKTLLDARMAASKMRFHDTILPPLK